MLTELEAFLVNRDLEGAGVVFAGGHDVVREVPVTMWELDSQAQDDQFPSAT